MLAPGDHYFPFSGLQVLQRLLSAICKSRLLCFKAEKSVNAWATTKGNFMKEGEF